MQQVEQESIIAAWLRVSIFKIYCNYLGDLLRPDPQPVFRPPVQNRQLLLRTRQLTETINLQVLHVLHGKTPNPMKTHP